MTEVLLFHHAAGQTPGFTSFADTLRAAGHTVHTPDVYEGHVFTDLDAGLAHAKRVGFDVLQERAIEAARAIPDAVVYAGFSIGAMPAQQLAQTRPGALGALLFDSCAPVSEWGDTWPAGVPVQVHGMDADEFFAEEGGDIDAARNLVSTAPEAELFLYPGDGHLFADSSLPSHDPVAAARLTERVLDFLSAR
ncbi:dienelactone hydrolase [Humibacillus sp. DSM 29435]|uniref:dienelactone hydrolase family protein n=1 Tax=Humibacillus sp. DSM 29435 TaxID=1869167 RepID=UPI000871C742|nr:dienelactone hydrolase family protein [Humibacillus sp. DSM 29435]OFE17326.1 dienelactone hydrolase [Humibacillus sp. DSM 29435]